MTDQPDRAQPLPGITTEWLNEQMKTRACRYCGKPVIDAIDTNGKKQVLSARDHPQYTLLPDGRWLRCSTTTKLSHFADCAQVEKAKAEQAAKKQEAGNG